MKSRILENGIIGNDDVAPLYFASVGAGGVAELVAKHRAVLNKSARGGAEYIATRERGKKTAPGKIVVLAGSVEHAIEAMRVIARGYFKPMKTPWRVGGCIVELY